jgi:hypothetical protein
MISFLACFWSEAEDFGGVYEGSVLGAEPRSSMSMILSRLDRQTIQKCSLLLPVLFCAAGSVA